MLYRFVTERRQLVEESAFHNLKAASAGNLDSNLGRASCYYKSVINEDTFEICIFLAKASLVRSLGECFIIQHF